MCVSEEIVARFWNWRTGAILLCVVAGATWYVQGTLLAALTAASIYVLIICLHYIFWPYSSDQVRLGAITVAVVAVLPLLIANDSLKRDSAASKSAQVDDQLAPVESDQHWNRMNWPSELPDDAPIPR